MPHISDKSSHYFDWEKFRSDLAREKEVRVEMLTKMSQTTGIHASQLTRFLNGDSETIGVDLTASLMKWLGRKFEDYLVPRFKTVRHVDTPEQRQLRTARTFLEMHKIEPLEGETTVETMMRLLSQAKTNGDI
jgi:hypothetical protein